MAETTLGGKYFDTTFLHKWWEEEPQHDRWTNWVYFPSEKFSLEWVWVQPKVDSRHHTFTETKQEDKAEILVEINSMGSFVYPPNLVWGTKQYSKWLVPTSHRDIHSEGCHPGISRWISFKFLDYIFQIILADTTQEIVVVVTKADNFHFSIGKNQLSFVCGRVLLVSPSPDLNAIGEMHCEPVRIRSLFQFANFRLCGE